MNIVFWILYLALLAGYFILLYSIPRWKRNQWLFYVLFYLPFAVTIGFVILALPILSIWWWMVLAVLILGYLFGYGVTMYEMAGEDKFMWFLLTFFISPLWIIYQLTKLR